MQGSTRTIRFILRLWARGATPQGFGACCWSKRKTIGAQRCQKTIRVIVSGRKQCSRRLCLSCICCSAKVINFFRFLFCLFFVFFVCFKVVLTILYLQQTNNSGEKALSSILMPGAFARLPLIDRFDAMPKEMPILFLYGASDWMDVNAAHHLTRSAPNWHVRTIANAGHQLAIENPDAFSENVVDFLNDEEAKFKPRNLERRRVAVRRKKVDDFEVIE